MKKTVGEEMREALAHVKAHPAYYAALRRKLDRQGFDWDRAVAEFIGKIAARIRQEKAEAKNSEKKNRRKPASRG
jgi:hypothetical protein